jgi:hypothetical protein
MEVLKHTTEIDDTGQLNINLSTNLEAGKVELLVIVNPIVEKAKRDTKDPKYDFSDLAGKLSWQGDAVSTQRKLRDEW